MKLRRKNHCKECPFRKIAPKGWLGPWHPEEVVAQVQGEGGFACHMTTNALLKNDPNISDEDLANKAHVCVGSLQSANKSCKSYRNPELGQWQSQVGKPEEIMDLFEFEEHHGGRPDPRKKK